MIVWDLLAALVIAFGAFYGARKGFWKIATGAGAVGLGAIAAWTVSGVLADALGDLGVGYPGDAVLGFFLPFALVSVYARYLAGLWLTKWVENSPERNRTLGAVVGAVWMLFAIGFVGRLAGVNERPAHARPQASYPPLVCWLTDYPGAVGAHIYLSRETKQDEEDRIWSDALECALDSGRVHSRTLEGDVEASQTFLRTEGTDERVARKETSTPPALSQH